jgi:1-acyl-sn-glycerol-3-phosphate acyltransferase
MNVWMLLGFAACLLAAARLIRPRTPPVWEFRGFVAFLWYLNAAYCKFYHKLESDPDPLPATGPAILICNHTCNIDHFLLQAGTGRKLGFLIARQFYDVPMFRPFCDLVDCIVVNRDGRDVSATRDALRALGNGRVVPLFPEGRISQTSGEVIGEAAPGVAFLATKAGVPVYPAYIRGTPKSNVVWKSFSTPSQARVYYGPAIDPREFVPPHGHEAERAFRAATAEKLMGAIAALRDRSIREQGGWPK